MKKIVIHGCYHTNNFGDLLILDVIAQHVMEVTNIPTEDVICPWIAGSQQDNVLPRAGRGLKDCWFAGTAIFGGGGYFTNGNTLRSQLRFLRYSVPALIWRLIGTPYAVIGVGAGPTISTFVRRQIRWLCAGASFVAVRDQESYQLLRDCGVKHRRLMQTADWIISLSREQIPSAAMFKAERLFVKEPTYTYVGIHFSKPDGIKPLLPVLLSVLQKKQTEQPNLRYIWLFDNSDAELATITSAFNDHGLKGSVLPKQDHWTTAAVISRLDAVFTSKLHVGITAWALGVVPVSLSYHGKTKRFYRQVNLAHCQSDFANDFSPLQHWLQQIANGELQHTFAMQRADRLKIQEMAKTNIRLLSGLLYRSDPATSLFY